MFRQDNNVLRVWWFIVLVLCFASCESDREDWLQAKAENSIEALEAFIERHPRGDFAAEARFQIELLNLRADSVVVCYGRSGEVCETIGVFGIALADEGGNGISPEVISLPGHKEVFVFRGDTGVEGLERGKAYLRMEDGTFAFIRDVDLDLSNNELAAIFGVN